MEHHAIAVELYPSGVLTKNHAASMKNASSILEVVAGGQQASCAACYTVITSAGVEEAYSHLLISKSHGSLLQIHFSNPVCVINS